MTKRIVNSSKIYKNWDTLLVAFCALIISISAIVFFFCRNEILLYGDARSHISIAREIVDNLTPGVAQLGAAWLPLFQILELLFVWNDVLWQTGLAGAIVSGAACVGSGIYIYLLVKEIIESRLAGFFAFLVFMLNPNILYMQSVPLAELLLLFSLIGSIYHFYNWVKKDSLNALLLSAFLVFLGTLVRYDAWFLVSVEMVLVFFWTMIRKKWASVDGKVILFGYISLFGILLWIVWNFVIWGNPFYFFVSKYSTQAQQHVGRVSGQLLGYRNITNALLIYFWTCADMAGISALFIAGWSSFLQFFKSKIGVKLILLILLLSVAVFNVLTLFLGISVINVPEITNNLNLFNIRYGLVILPFVSVMPFIVSKNKVYNSVVFVCIAASLINLIVNNYVVTYNDGLYGVSRFPAIDYIRAQWFREHYDNSGLVMVSFASNHPLTQAIKLPMHIYVHEGTRQYWQNALKNPDKVVKWVIVRKGDDIDQEFSGTRKLNHFIKVYVSSDEEVYRYKDAVNKY